MVGLGSEDCPINVLSFGEAPGLMMREPLRDPRIEPGAGGVLGLGETPGLVMRKPLRDAGIGPGGRRIGAALGAALLAVQGEASAGRIGVILASSASLAPKSSGLEKESAGGSKLASRTGPALQRRVKPLAWSKNRSGGLRGSNAGLLAAADTTLVPRIPASRQSEDRATVEAAKRALSADPCTHRPVPRLERRVRARRWRLEPQVRPPAPEPPTEGSRPAHPVAPAGADV